MTANQKERRAALDRILAAVRAEVAYVAPLEAADWLDYALLRQDGLESVADDLVSESGDDEELASDFADLAASVTTRDYLRGVAERDEDRARAAAVARLDRLLALAEELDPLLDEPLVGQPTW